MPKVKVEVSIENNGASTVKSKSAYILLDKSGSMSRNWVETVGAMNAYVAELAADETSSDTRVTLAAFDMPTSTLDFAVLRRDVPARDWKPVDPGEATPRGYTPLFDAIGRIASTAEADQSERSVVVVITDGAENASREITREGAKAALDRCRARGWQVVFIGADFDAFGQSKSVGGAVGQTISMTSDSYIAATKTLARKTRSYANLAGSSADAEFMATANATMSFNEDDRAEAAGRKRAPDNK